jgi:transposase
VICQFKRWLAYSAVTEKSLTSISRYRVNDGAGKDDLSGVTSIAVDETMFRRGRQYVTAVTGADGRRVIDALPGRDAAAVDNFAEKLSRKGGDPDAAGSVTSGVSEAFIAGVKASFPNAETIIGKFHVKRTLPTAPDQARKEEQSSCDSKKPLFHGRRIFWIPESKLT